MKLSNKKKWGLGFAAALVLGVVACKSTLSVEAHGEVMGQKGAVKIRYDGGEVKADKLPPSTRADVKFFDSDGKPVDPGATGVGQGERVAVPQGASYCEVSGASSATSCTGCTGSGGGSGGGGMLDLHEHDLAAHARADQETRKQASASAESKWVYVFTLDPDIDSSSAWGNVAASFFLSGDLSAEQIHLAIEPILRGGHGTPVPAGIVVDTYVRMLGEKLGGRLFVADVTAGFQSLTMT
jgi:hypothetical protein